MTIFIVLAVVASLLGSILWVMPSKREQDKMKLRLLARKSQLGVQLTYIELPDKWDKSTTKVKATAYHKFRVNKLNTLNDNVCLYPYEVWKYNSISQYWYSNQTLALSERSKEFLDNNEQSFKGIIISVDSVSLFWDELGDEEDIPKIDLLLKEIEGMTF